MKIQTSILVADMSGKLGGGVVMKNRGGLCVRTKTSPINPQTTDQSAIRSRMTTLSKHWGALSDSQRNEWAGAVGNFKKSNIFGNKITPSGLNLFVKLNCNIMSQGGAMILVPPAVANLDAITDFSMSAVNGTGIVTATLTVVTTANECVVFEATPAVNPGKTFVKNQFRVLGNMDHSTVYPVAITILYSAKFGAVGAVGKKIYFKAYVLNNVTGQKGIPVQAVAVIS